MKSQTPTQRVSSNRRCPPPFGLNQITQRLRKFIRRWADPANLLIGMTRQVDQGDLPFRRVREECICKFLPITALT